MSYMNSYLDLKLRISRKISNKMDLFERKTIKKMRNNGHLFFLSELIPYFKGTKLFMFGTGGSTTNLQNVSRLRNYNLMIVSLGPLYMYRVYNFMPNIWYLHYGPIARVLLEEEKKTPLDFSETFVFIPANDSQSKIFFSSPIVKEFRRRHPEATFVLYREKGDPITLDNIHSSYLYHGVEPLRALNGSNVENTFLPMCAFLGASTLFFSGVDHLHSTGHFWDRNRFYQSMDGRKIDFPDEKLILKCASIAQAICAKKNIKCYRLEAKETVLKTYPYIDFEQALAQASPKIIPESIRKSYKTF